MQTVDKFFVELAPLLTVARKVM